MESSVSAGFCTKVFAAAIGVEKCCSEEVSLAEVKGRFDAEGDPGTRGKDSWSFLANSGSEKEPDRFIFLPLLFIGNLV